MTLDIPPVEYKDELPIVPTVKGALKASAPERAAPPSKMDLSREADMQLPQPRIMKRSIDVPAEPLLFYFSRDANIQRIKYFDTEIDENLQTQILFKNRGLHPSIRTSSTFEPSSKFKVSNMQTLPVEFGTKTSITAPLNEEAVE